MGADMGGGPCTERRRRCRIIHQGSDRPLPGGGVQRWQQLTGRDAICAENQETFEKLASERSGER